MPWRVFLPISKSNGFFCALLRWQKSLAKSFADLNTNWSFNAINCLQWLTKKYWGIFCGEVCVYALNRRDIFKREFSISWVRNLMIIQKIKYRRRFLSSAHTHTHTHKCFIKKKSRNFWEKRLRLIRIKNVSLLLLFYFLSDIFFSFRGE